MHYTYNILLYRLLFLLKSTPMSVLWLMLDLSHHIHGCVGRIIHTTFTKIFTTFYETFYHDLPNFLRNFLPNFLRGILPSTWIFSQGVFQALPFFSMWNILPHRKFRKGFCKHFIFCQIQKNFIDYRRPFTSLNVLFYQMEHSMGFFRSLRVGRYVSWMHIENLWSLEKWWKSNTFFNAFYYFVSMRTKIGDIKKELDCRSDFNDI